MPHFVGMSIDLEAVCPGHQRKLITMFMILIISNWCFRVYLAPTKKT